MNRRAFLLAALVSIVLGIAACSGDDEGGSTTSSTADPSTTTSTATADTTSTTPVTEPPGTDTAAVQPILQSLIDRYDTAVAAILADPRVASNSEHEAVVSYLRLFTPGSSFPQTALEFWAEEGAQGRFYRPGPRGEMYVSTVQTVQADSPDQANVTVCTLRSVVVVDASGNQVSAEGGQIAGAVVAVRVDGVWRLRDLTRTAADRCPEPPDQP